MDLADILEGTRGTLVQKGATDRFQKIGTDTRTIAPGDIYFALVGKQHDGHAFLDQAIARGAQGLVVSQPLSATCPAEISVIQVADTTRALGGVAALVRMRRNPKIVSITGSVGKTTAKELVAHLLSQEFHTLKSAASFNNQFGVPLTLLALDDSHTHAVVEAGTNHVGEIAVLGDIIKPDVGIITNIGFAHIENFGSQQAILEEKIQLLKSLRPGGAAILNGDDPLLRSQDSVLRGWGIAVITAGLNAGNTVQAVEIVATEQGTTGFIQGNIQGPGPAGKWRHPFHLRVPGEHFVQSAVLGVAAAVFLGVAPHKAVQALETFALPAGRMNCVQADAKTLVIDDTYNASPDAMMSAVRALRIFSAERKIAILGEMRELGDFSGMCHRAVGKELAGIATDLIAVGSAAEFFRQGAQEAGFDPQRLHWVENATQALDKIREIRESATETMAILVKGSRFMHMERVVLGLSGAVAIACTKSPCTLYLHCKDCQCLTSGAL